MTLSPTLSLVL